MKEFACPQLSSHKCVTTGLPKAMASNIFRVRTNPSITKCVASEQQDAIEKPNRAIICGWNPEDQEAKKINQHHEVELSKLV